MPPSKPRAAVHVDLDGAEHIFRVHGRRWENSRDALFETGLLGCLELFEQRGIPATLFLIAEDLDRPEKAELVDEASKRGFEIASHTLTHPDLTTLDRDAKRREIFASRDRIAESCGTVPAGFRAPQFRFDAECAQLLDEAGYRWDSSLFPSDKAGPYPLLGGVTELPMPPKLFGAAPFHPSYSLALGDGLFRMGLRRAARSEAPLILLFHLTDFAEPLPNDALPIRKLKYFTLSHLSAAHKRDRCRRMLDEVEQRYEVCPTASLLEVADEQ